MPIYLFHRFQIQAVGKLMGGQYFNYRVRGDAQADARPVAVARQQQAIDALLATLDPSVLKLPQRLAELITPRVPNNPKSRETFTGATGINFDILAPARTAVALTLQVLMDRSARRGSSVRARQDLWRLPAACLTRAGMPMSASGIEANIQRQTSYAGPLWCLVWHSTRMRGFPGSCLCACASVAELQTGHRRSS